MDCPGAADVDRHGDRLGRLRAPPVPAVPGGHDADALYVDQWSMIRSTRTRKTLVITMGTPINASLGGSHQL